MWPIASYCELENILRYCDPKELFTHKGTARRHGDGNPEEVRDNVRSGTQWEQKTGGAAGAGSP